MTLKKAYQIQQKIKKKIFFSDINIKYCVWHFKKLFEIQKNRSCSNKIDNNNNLYTYNEAILNFPFINPI